MAGKTQKPEPVLDDGDVVVFQGDCVDVMRQLEDESIDSIVTDPPYWFEGMGFQWDEFEGPLDFQLWCQNWATEALRILKPGGYLLAFAASRTFHRMAVGIEDAGFDIKDAIAWLYASGFPKSFDISKNIDTEAGVIDKREVVGVVKGALTDWNPGGESTYGDRPITKPYSEDAKRWEGWGTALKPAFEPIVMAKKPLKRPRGSYPTIAKHVVELGTGAINIDGCRIDTGIEGDTPRWPANVAFDEEAAAMLDEAAYPKKASRFFYTTKASSVDRHSGGLANNIHPTVKPTPLMRWLIRMVTQPDGLVLDPFGGSGSTGVAARAESMRCILIEKEDDYIEIIRNRLSQLSLFAPTGNEQ